MQYDCRNFSQHLLWVALKTRLRSSELGSLSNAVCFKHDNNVCACAVSVLILLPIANLSIDMDSATSISHMTLKVSPFDAAFSQVGDFSLRMRAQFWPYYYFQLKSDVIINIIIIITLFAKEHDNKIHDKNNTNGKSPENIHIQRARFPYKTLSFLALDIFSDFCDNNICACAVSTLILLPFVNISPKMDSGTSISYTTRKF